MCTLLLHWPSFHKTRKLFIIQNTPKKYKIKVTHTVLCIQNGVRINSVKLHFSTGKTIFMTSCNFFIHFMINQAYEIILIFDIMLNQFLCNECNFFHSSIKIFPGLIWNSYIINKTQWLNIPKFASLADIYHLLDIGFINFYI